MLYVTAVLSFIFFSFKNHLTQFLQNQTTFTSKYEEVTHLEFPTLIFCVKHGYKMEAMEKFGFTSIYDFPGKEKSNHEDVSAIYDEITYQHGADYTISINSSINFATENIYTFRYGKCHKIQPLEKMEANQRNT